MEEITEVTPALCKEKHKNVNTQIEDIKIWLQNIEKKYNGIIYLLVGNLAGVIGILINLFFSKG